MAPPSRSYTKVTHSATYDGINPTQPGLSSAGKVVLITGASGGIGRATASSFAASGPRALILLGRRADALAETANVVRSRHAEVLIQSHEAELCDATSVRNAMNKVAAEFGGIDTVIHCAGVLAPVVPLLEADPATFLDGYKTTVVGSLVTAQAVVLANKKVSPDEDKPVTLVNLTTADYDDETYLSYITSLLGPAPKDLVRRGKRTSMFYTAAGTLKKEHLVPSNLSFESTVSKFNEEEKRMFISFVNRMIKWKPEERSTAKELLQDPWLHNDYPQIQGCLPSFFSEVEIL